MKIREGRIEDAAFLATVVTGAMGPELCLGLARNAARLPLIDNLFARFAASPASQYSYKNALIAETDGGVRAGGIIAYDGADLHRLRRAFAREANAILGWNVTEDEADEWDDEASPDEIYIDSLYVAPEFRKMGVASALLKATEQRFPAIHKPLGLLVEPGNHTALQSYTHWGFKKVGISNFFSTPMIHMQKPQDLP